MIETILQSVFYNRIVPNSVAVSISVLVILAFRQLMARWSKGYVRMLWILLLVQLLAPPLFRIPFYTVRDFGVKTIGIRAGQQESVYNQPDRLMETEDGTVVFGIMSQLPKEQAADDGESQPGKKGSMEQTGNGQGADIERKNPLPTGIAQPVSGYLQSENGQWLITVFESLFGVQKIGILHNASIWAVRLWIAGVFAWAVYYLYLYLRMKKSLGSASRVPGQDYWVSQAASMPFVMPGIPPKIYLPASMAQEQREHILAHERQHIRNMDPLLKCTALFTAVIYWFHPLVWIAVSLFGKDMEMYCDECVLRGKSMEQRRAYAVTLLKFASKSRGFMLAMNFAKSNVEHRIGHILNVRKPSRIVCLLLAAFIGISGFFFLSEKSVESKAGTVISQEKSSGTKQADGTNKAPAYRQDAHKFAKRIVRMVKSGNKEALAKMIAFPILIYLDGEETNIVDAESFISNYGKIADKKWKSAVLRADMDEMSSNYMGYNIGNGAVWFSEQIGREGYWIYAINNSGEERFADDSQSARKGWEKLAASQGMAKEEARRWYTRFAKEGMCENGLNFRFTGCAYGDFDGNGFHDIFVISSLSPHEIYPESVTKTMYVYGFINGELVYERGFDAFSQDGFKQFDVEAGKKPGISCTIRFSADTDRLEEDQYLLEIGTKGWVVSGTCLTETEKVIHMLAQIPKEKYKSALSYEERQYMDYKEWGKDYVVLLQSIPDADIRMYGYDGKEYGTRGIIVDYNGTYSFFDLSWDSYRFKPQMYQGDYDGDSMQEFAVIYPYGYGTGIFLEGLFVFDVQPDHTVLCSQMIMDHWYLKSQLEPFIKYDRATGKIKIIKDGETKKVIDLTSSPDYKENKDTLVIAYTNIIQFEVDGNHIKMLTEVTGSPYGTTLYLEGVENTTTAFEVIYSADGFRFDITSFI